MKISDLLYEAAGIATRFLPWRARPGLLPVGNPGPDSPVLLTGNYQITVRRVLRALRGLDAWVLVTDSGGINIWCAASGGRLTDQGVISLLRSSGVAERVNQRRLILPRLTASGLRPDVISEHTGWEVVFGPVIAGDIPDYLEKGRAVKKMRKVEFRTLQRLEIGAIWAVPIALLLLAVGWPMVGLAAAGLSAATAVFITLGLCILLLRVPVLGWRRLLTLFGAALVFTLISGSVWILIDGFSAVSLGLFGLIGLLVSGVLTADLAGTTPIFGSGFLRTDLYHVAVVPRRCRGVAVCETVCPRDVIQVEGRKAGIALPDNCIRCGACIVQCPEDAILFIFQDGSYMDAHTVRTRKLDLRGRRSVSVPDLPSRKME